MPITNHIRDNWCRFQGELFPEIQDAVGPLLKKYQGFVMALEIACPENFILTSDVFLRNLLILFTPDARRALHRPFRSDAWILLKR